MSSPATETKPVENGSAAAPAPEVKKESSPAAQKYVYVYKGARSSGELVSMSQD